MRSKLLIFLLGAVLGAAVATIWPRFVAPRLPQGLRPSTETVEGTVIRKLHDGGQLLLTIDTPEGAALATFTEKVPEINLLVETNDTVTLGLGGYEPFVDNPAIRGVRKARVAPEPESGDEESLDPAAPASEAPPAELEEWPTADAEG